MQSTPIRFFEIAQCGASIAREHTARFLQHDENASENCKNLFDQLDCEALKALILAPHEQVFSHQKQLSTQQEEILSQREQLASRDAEIEHLKLLIAKLRRQQFGRSSEKREYQIEQLELRLEELEARRTKETAAVKESAPASTAVARPVRRPLPDHLPREVRKYLPKQEA
jgi:transposase